MRVLMAFIVGMMALLAPAGAQEIGEELLRNPGFNEDANGDELPDGWNTSPRQVLWREKQYQSKDYEIVSRPGTYVLATQDVQLKPGKQYTLSLSCKAVEGGLAGALLLHGPDQPRREMQILWNIQATDRYEEYVAIFTAPDPACRLYLYNVAKTKGTVSYDRVSLREGVPDRPVFTPLSWKPIDSPLTDPPTTPHLDWASPLAGGALKTLITLRTTRGLRQAAELAQRIDLDYDVVDTGYEGRDLISETARRIATRLKERDYRVYLVASRLPEALAKEIRQQVEAGAGLVVLEGFGQAGKIVPLNNLKEVAADHYVREGIPWDLVPEEILSSVQVGNLGKGRVVRLLFPPDKARVWGLLPQDLDYTAHRTRQCAYWEWWYSLLSRALVWTAGREGTARLEAEAAPGGVRLRVANAPAGSRVRAIVRSGREIRFDGPTLRQAPVTVPVAADGTATLALPETLPAGTVLVDAMLLNPAGEVIAWGSFPFEQPQAVRISALETASESYRIGEPAQATLRCAADASVDAVVEARLIDAFGRVVGRQSISRRLSRGESRFTLALRPARPLTVLHRIFARILVGGKEQDSRWVAVTWPKVGPARAVADFVATTWAPGMSHPLELEYYGERTRDLGLNSEFAINPHMIAEHAMLAGGYMRGIGFRETGWNETGVRPTCLSDPAVIEAYRQTARESATNQRPYGFFGVGIADEAFLTSRHRRYEVCFSEHCQARYRRWLRARYPSLEALNARWGTAYRSWEEIRGARTEEVRGKESFAPFVEFRTFMTDVWVEACRDITAAYHEVAPETPTGHTNTFGADPFNGNDYWKLATATGFGWGQEYSEAIKRSAHKAIFDLWRSFVETPQAKESRRRPGMRDVPPFHNYGWIGYDHRVEAAHYEPWWLALHGARGVSYYATNAVDSGRGVSWALIHPTLSDTGYGLAVKEALRDLRAGCGKLFLEYQREEPRIALLWSYPSMLVSWCESTWTEPEPNERDGTDSYGSYFRSALHFRQHVNELQHDYIYLAPDQILEGNLLERYPVLYLPFTIAESEALVQKLDAYVQNGGVLVGDLRCLRTDECGKPYAGPGPLRQLFGVERTGGQVEYGPTTLQVTEAAAGIDLRGKELSLYGRESLRVVEGKPLARHATGEPALIVRPHGKGVAIYLNFSLPEYDVTTRELVRQILARAGIQRDIVAENPGGETPPRCYERNTFSRGPIAVHAFIRDHRRCTDSDPVRFRFGKPAHLYDVRAGRYLGHVAETQAVVPPGQTALYACLPYQVTKVTVTLPSKVRGGSVLTARASISAGEARPGDHIFHIQVIDPAGNEVRAYTTNALAPGGQLDLPLSFAWNDPPGAWEVVVRDVLTGVSGEAGFTLE
jgi:hypothetical protein